MKTRFGMAFVLFAVALIVPAIFHGAMTGRWGEPADRLSAARRLEEFPREFGTWIVREENELSTYVLNELRSTGYLNRAYLNRTTGEFVSVIVLVGPPGPTTRHSPDICYGNRNNRLIDTPEPVSVEQPGVGEHVFKVLRFQPAAPEASPFTVCYAWSDGGLWQVPDYPRLVFGGQDYLFKLQLVSENSTFLGEEVADTWQRFLADFLPVLHDRVLQPRPLVPVRRHRSDPPWEATAG